MDKYLKIQSIIDLMLPGKPRERHQAFCRAWNRLVINSRRNELRKLSVPRYAKRYGIERALFLPSLRDDINAYQTYLTCRDPLAEKAPLKPLRPETAEERVKQLYRCASALVHSGHDINSIDSLSLLVEPDNVRRILRFFIDRNGGEKSNKMTSDIAEGLCKLALRFVEVPVDQMDRLREFKKMVKVEMKSMTPGNRAILRCFNDHHMVDRFKALPWKNIGQALTGPVNAKTAIQFQKAVAMIILMHAPMRLKNLCNLHLDQHLNWTAAPGKLLIVIPGDEVKNEEELSFELPSRSVTAISTYISTYRPLLFKGANDFLFPGQNGRPKTLNNLSQQLAKFTFDGIGVRLTAHRFRHQMGKIFLDACPG